MTDCDLKTTATTTTTTIFVGQHNKTRKCKTNENRMHILFKLCDWEAAKGQLGHSMSTHTSLLPTISDFAEIWHACRFG